MRALYWRATGLPHVVRRAGALRARTMVFDVEPLVAHWNGGQEELNRGIAMVLDGLAALSGLEVVCFATNSVRRPSILPCGSGRRVIYLPSALKPLRTAPYQGFPRPGMLIGDQIATDGILARRLGYAFVLYDASVDGVPLGPRLLGAFGRLVRPLLFRHAG